MNPHGLTTVYAFQFGTTTGYGAQTAPVSVGNGTAEVKVNQTITGLPPGAMYHYRLIATNAAGTANGKDATFKTQNIPLTFKLTVEPNPVVFGSPLSIRAACGRAPACHAQAQSRRRLELKPGMTGPWQILGSPRVPNRAHNRPKVCGVEIGL
jgi:hypothetical protein